MPSTLTATSILPALKIALPLLDQIEWPVLITNLRRITSPWLAQDGGQSVLRYSSLDELAATLAKLLDNGYVTIRLTFATKDGAVRNRDLQAWELEARSTAVRDLDKLITRLMAVRRDHASELCQTYLMQAQELLTNARSAWANEANDESVERTMRDEEAVCQEAKAEQATLAERLALVAEMTERGAERGALPPMEPLAIQGTEHAAQQNAARRAESRQRAKRGVAWQIVREHHGDPDQDDTFWRTALRKEAFHILETGGGLMFARTVNSAAGLASLAEADTHLASFAACWDEFSQ